ncbi:hypothetical protein D3C85_1437100 [compost metagenome]
MSSKISTACPTVCSSSSRSNFSPTASRFVAWAPRIPYCSASLSAPARAAVTKARGEKSDWFTASLIWVRAPDKCLSMTAINEVRSGLGVGLTTTWPPVALFAFRIASLSRWLAAISLALSSAKRRDLSPSLIFNCASSSSLSFDLALSAVSLSTVARYLSG